MPSERSSRPIATPIDKPLAELNVEIGKTIVPYGTDAAQAAVRIAVDSHPPYLMTRPVAKDVLALPCLVGTAVHMPTSDRDALAIRLHRSAGIRSCQGGAHAENQLRHVQTETIREFGLEQLADSGEEADTRSRHAASDTLKD